MESPSKSGGTSKIIVIIPNANPSVATTNPDSIVASLTCAAPDRTRSASHPETPRITPVPVNQELHHGVSVCVVRYSA